VAIRIVQTTVADKIESVGALLHEHWAELATNPALMVLKPDAAKYAFMEHAGVLVSLCAYDGDQMIGYSVNTLSAHLHYADLTVLHNDVLFVSKEYRSGRTGIRLIQATEAAAKEKGAHMMVWHAKPQTALEAILPRVGYRVQDVMFSKAM